MTVLTDVPGSGIYFQQGYVVDLVFTITDITTGLPVQLQTASGLTIALEYPDGTTQSFVAQLFTDGSDGRIVYRTRNDGDNDDLMQVGLYHMQGLAVVNGIQVPPSYKTDFYVLPNVFGGSDMPIFTPSAIVMYDSDNVRWVGTVASGVISWNAQPSGPSSFLQFNNLVMKDINGQYWTITMGTDGVPIGTLGGTFEESINSFLMTDLNNLSWVVTVSEEGELVAS